VDRLWDSAVLPSLKELVAIPALSPGFDPEWAGNGHLDAAVNHMRDWALGQDLPGVRIDVERLPDRSPLLLIDVPATPGARDQGTVLLYGHLDKQPPMDDWGPGLGPWTPVERDGRLYGRGSVDDGYAGYAALVAVLAARENRGAHARCVVLLETGEESGSPDLPAYLDHLGSRLGQVSLVICLDSGAADYERMWLTTSLRGMTQVAVTVRVLESGQHSGVASGVVPSSFRILRLLLDRLEDSATGMIRLSELHTRIPEDRLREARETTAALPGMLADVFPLAAGTEVTTDDDTELLLRRTWRPTLSVVGADGWPPVADAGNVLRASTTLALSLRLPPTADSAAALKAVRRVLTTDVPYGAVVELTRDEHADGWNAPDFAPWLTEALDELSPPVFGNRWRTLGEGGSIPFMGLLHATYPEAQFVVTGALGPDSNAHVPDESLHLAFAAKITTAVAGVLDAHARRS
jgi:acetylornithine deacetylase/succinyl-diaminopimelate desuccinylase-like protein